MQQPKISIGPHRSATTSADLDTASPVEANGRTHIGNGVAAHTSVRKVRTEKLPDNSPGSGAVAGALPNAKGEAVDSRATKASTSAAREHYRFAIAVIITLFYLALLGPMFYLGIALPGAGMTVESQGNQWVVTGVMPNGLAYDNRIQLGDVIVRVNDIGVERLGDAAYGPPNFTGADTITVRRLNPGQDPSGSNEPLAKLNLSTHGQDNPIRRWTYALLGLIFIGVGGPVFVKGRQRTAAAAFYAFCVSTALAFAFVIGINSGNPVVLSLLFVSLVVFAASFTLFFFNFPIRTGRSERVHDAMVAAVVGSGLAVLAAYAWAIFVEPYAYDVIRLIMFLYLGACIVSGLVTLIRGWIAQRSPEVRQQLLLLLGGTVIAVGPPTLLTLVPAILFTNEGIIRMELSAVALGIMPLAFAYAITQHQLLGVRNFVRRSVVYVIMGSVVLLVFSVAASLLTVVLKGWPNNEFGLIGFGFFVFLLAFSYSHLQRRVERLVDRYIYHDAYDYKEALLQFSSQLASEQKLNVLCDQLVERTCRLMNLTCGALLLAMHPDETGKRTGISRFRYVGLPTVLLDASDLEPGERELQTGLLGTIEDAWNQANGSAGNSVPSADGTVFLHTYSRYGESADELINGLQDELSHLGINLYKPESATGSNGAMFSGTHAGSDLTTAVINIDTGVLVASSGVRKVSSLADAVAGFEVTEVVKPESARKARGAELDTIRSFLGVPLWTRSRFVGVLCLAGKKTGERFTKDDLSLLSTLGSQAALAVYNAQLHEAREQALLDTITALAHAIEAKDGYTIEHCEKMTGRAVALAHAISLPRQEVENIRLGAILHDVGKIGIPDAVLNKPGKLTPEEYETIKEHAAIGARIVQSVGALHGVVPIVRHHQERYDGSGYPDGLAGEDIPIGARIIGVVDTYGAMTEDRVYRKAPGHARAVDELQRLSGKQFDPIIVEAFVRLLEEHPDLGELDLQNAS